MSVLFSVDEYVSFPYPRNSNVSHVPGGVDDDVVERALEGVDQFTVAKALIPRRRRIHLIWVNVWVSVSVSVWVKVWVWVSVSVSVSVWVSVSEDLERGSMRKEERSFEAQCHVHYSIHKNTTSI